MTDTAKEYDQGSPAWRTIMKWGTNARFARSIGRTPSTTQRWLENGWIPPQNHGEVIEAARRDYIIVRPLDFVDVRLFNDTELEPYSGKV